MLRTEHPSSVLIQREDSDGVWLCQTAQTGSNGKLVKQDDVMNTLDRTNSTAVAALDFNPTDARLRYAHDDVSQTLTARAGTGGNQVPLIQVQPVAFLYNQGSKARSLGLGEISPTLKTDHNPVVAFAQNQCDDSREQGDVAGALVVRQGAKQQTYICRADGQTNAMTSVNLAPTLTSHAKKDPPFIYPADDSDEGKGSLSQQDTSITADAEERTEDGLMDHRRRGATFRKKYSDRPRPCPRISFVRWNPRKQEESWPSLDSARKNQVDNTLTGLRNRATLFAQNWQNRGNEKSEARSFWMELLQDVLQLSDTNNPKTVCFERKTGLNGYIDVLMIKSRVLVEQKSLGVDLDKPEKRQGLMLTPIQQAKRYADNLPPSGKPTVLITCNFGRFRIYDLEQDWIASKPQSEFTLADLPNHVNELARLFQRESTKETIRVVQQEELSVKAGIYVAQLHDALAKCFPNPDDPVEHMALAMITVRIVFCLYAEDAGLFMANAFHDYVEHSSPDRLHTDLYDLFLYLDTAPENRPKYPDPRLKSFPYVDGGLFNELIDVPPLTGELRDTLLLISEKFDWRDISPVIFGSLMEETLSRDERRKGGMHYTSVRNIHRVIDPCSSTI